MAYDNLGHLIKEDILKGLKQGLSKIEVARYLYISLGKKLVYDRNFNVNIESSSNDSIYNKIIDFNNLDTNRIICKSWATLYRELLLASGSFSEKDVVIKRSNARYSHVWVEIDLDSNLKVIADATNVYNVNGLMANDLSNIKMEKETFGFLLESKEKEISSVDDLRKEVEKQSTNEKIKSFIKKIDTSLGYIEGEYKDVINSYKTLVNNFKDNSLIEKMFSKSSLSTSIIPHISSYLTQNGYGTYEAYTFTKNIFSSRLNIDIRLAGENNGYFTLAYNIGLDDELYYVYDEEKGFKEVSYKEWIPLGRRM